MIYIDIYIYFMLVVIHSYMIVSQFSSMKVGKAALVQVGQVFNTRILK